MRRALVLVGLLALAAPARAGGSAAEPQAKRLESVPQAKSLESAPQAMSFAAQPRARAFEDGPLAPGVRDGSPAWSLDDGTPAAGQEVASKLAPAILRGSAQVPELWLAQRSIDREWGPSDDSLYRTVEIHGWKSEGGAMLMSAALPGTGQLYVGESSGWFFMAGEVLLWVGRVITRHDGVKLSEQAASFVGDPTDSSATWSFARYAAATGGSATQLEKLWSGDRDSYYQALASDPSYRSGFSGTDPDLTYESYRGIRENSQDRFSQSRRLEMASWVNHTLAAFDALRAAHFHNVPLRRALELQVHGSLHHGEPQLRASLLRRF
jgi:hypothetical protein